MKVVLEPGLDVPHVDLMTTAGDPVRYGDLWQHRALLLISARDAADARAFEEALRDRVGEIDALGAKAVVSTTALEGLPHPGILIADRWGEICHVAPRPESCTTAFLDELMSWLQFVQARCPECEGEAR